MMITTYTMSAFIALALSPSSFGVASAHSATVPQATDDGTTTTTGGAGKIRHGSIRGVSNKKKLINDEDIALSRSLADGCKVEGESCTNPCDDCCSGSSEAHSYQWSSYLGQYIGKCGAYTPAPVPTTPVPTQEPTPVPTVEPTTSVPTSAPTPAPTWSTPPPTVSPTDSCLQGKTSALFTFYTFSLKDGLPFWYRTNKHVCAEKCIEDGPFKDHYSNVFDTEDAIMHPVNVKNTPCSSRMDIEYDYCTEVIGATWKTYNLKHTCTTAEYDEADVYVCEQDCDDTSLYWFNCDSGYSEIKWCTPKDSDPYNGA